MDGFDHAGALKRFQGPPGVTRPHFENRCYHIFVIWDNTFLLAKDVFSWIFCSSQTKASSLIKSQVLSQARNPHSSLFWILGNGKSNPTAFPPTSFMCQPYSRNRKLHVRAERSRGGPWEPRGAPKHCKRAWESFMFSLGRTEVARVLII